MLAHISWRWGFLASAVIAGGGVSYAIESRHRAVWLAALLIVITSSFWRELSHYDEPSDRIGMLVTVLLIVLLAVVGFVLAERSVARERESAEAFYDASAVKPSDRS
jgi:MFS family permease